MRLNTLLKYHFMTVKRAVIIFYSFYMLGALLSAVLTSVLGSNVSIAGSVTSDNGVQGWSTSIISFAIFMLVSSLIGSQGDTRFLISRSVSRKEIFLSNAIFLLPLAAIMSVLQIASIYIDSFVRYILGSKFRGLEVDVQYIQAPDMNNIFVFFIVSFSIMLCFGAMSYLLGSLLARWKLPTIGVLIISGMGCIALLAVPDFFTGLTDILEYMFTDERAGLMIALKQILLAAGFMIIAFPIMRRIIAAKQS